MLGPSFRVYWAIIRSNLVLPRLIRAKISIFVTSIQCIIVNILSNCISLRYFITLFLEMDIEHTENNESAHPIFLDFSFGDVWAHRHLCVSPSLAKLVQSQRQYSANLRLRRSVPIPTDNEHRQVRRQRL